MTKEDAIIEMKLGNTVSHELFIKDESITMVNNMIVDENGYTWTPDLFWKDRTGIEWKTGWKVI